MDSPEFKSLEECYPTLVACIQRAPNDIADQLRPLGLLPKQVLSSLKNFHKNDDEKAREIIDAVMFQVLTDSNVLQSFIQALTDAGSWTRSTVDELQKSLSKLCVVRQSLLQYLRSNYSIKRKFSPEQSAISFSAHHQEKQKRPHADLDIEDILYKPAAMRQDLIPTQVIDLQEVDWDPIKKLFNELQESVRESLEAREIKPKEVVAVVKSYEDTYHIRRDKKVIFLEMKEECLKCKTFLDFWLIFQDFFKFFSFVLLRVVVDSNLATETDRKNLKEYEVKFESYSKEVMSRYFDTCRVNDTKTEIIVKINESYEKFSKSHLCEFKKKLGAAINVEPHLLCLNYLEDGCIVLTYNAPIIVEFAAFPLTMDQEKSLFSLRVIWLKCGKYLFLNKVETKLGTYDHPDSDDDYREEWPFLESQPASGGAPASPISEQEIINKLVTGPFDSNPPLPIVLEKEGQHTQDSSREANSQQHVALIHAREGFPLNDEVNISEVIQNHEMLSRSDKREEEVESLEYIRQESHMYIGEFIRMPSENHHTKQNLKTDQMSWLEDSEKRKANLKLFQHLPFDQGNEDLLYTMFLNGREGSDVTPHQKEPQAYVSQDSNFENIDAGTPACDPPLMMDGVKVGRNAMHDSHNPLLELEHQIPAHAFSDPGFLQFIERLDCKPTNSHYVCYRLLAIGDEMDQRYDDQLKHALDDIFMETIESSVSWERFNAISKRLLLQGQKVQDGIMLITCFGRRLAEMVPNVGDTVTGFTQLVVDTYASEKLLSIGGWGRLVESYDHIETPLQDNELNDKDYPKYGYLDKEEQIGPELSLIVSQNDSEHPPIPDPQPPASTDVPPATQSKPTIIQVTSDPSPAPHQLRRVMSVEVLIAESDSTEHAQRSRHGNTSLNRSLSTSSLEVTSAHFQRQFFAFDCPSPTKPVSEWFQYQVTKETRLRYTHRGSVVFVYSRGSAIQIVSGDHHGDMDWPVIVSKGSRNSLDGQYLDLNLDTFSPSGSSTLGHRRDQPSNTHGRHPTTGPWSSLTLPLVAAVLAVGVVGVLRFYYLRRK